MSQDDIDTCKNLGDHRYKCVGYDFVYPPPVEYGSHEVIEVIRTIYIFECVQCGAKIKGEFNNA